MNTSSATRLSRYLGLALGVLILGACASTPTPTAHLDLARETIAQAERADARQFANVELEEARQRLTRAERASTADDLVLSQRLAHQSRVSAELAMARTESAKAAEINRELLLGVEALRAEMRRQGEQQ